MNAVPKLTTALRDMLEDIDNNEPDLAEIRGPLAALANKLRKRGLVETYRRSLDAVHADETRAYRTTDAGRAVLGRGLTEATRAKLEAEIKLMLHASRDCQRNQKQDTGKLRFDCRNAYYGEAFGILRAVKALGWGDFGAVNKPGNLSSWMHEIERQVLAEENFGGSNECDHCLERYGKDGAGRTRR